MKLTSRPLKCPRCGGKTLFIPRINLIVKLPNKDQHRSNLPYNQTWKIHCVSCSLEFTARRYQTEEGKGWKSTIAGEEKVTWWVDIHDIEWFHDWAEVTVQGDKRMWIYYTSPRGREAICEAYPTPDRKVTEGEVTETVPGHIWTVRIGVEYRQTTKHSMVRVAKEMMEAWAADYQQKTTISMT